MKLIEFTPSGIYCRQGDFYIDPIFPVRDAVITHAHADHARWGMQHYLCHKFSVPILKRRIDENISVQGVDYGETVIKNGVKITLFPAGHIIGSAQVRVEYKGFVSVVSGDYKLQDDGLSTPFETVKCNEFVTESTFALPVYRWLPIEEINKKMQDWALQNLADGKSSVFVGYSLGKAQRILKALDGIEEIMVHSSIARLNEAFEETGIHLPNYSLLDFNADKKSLSGKIFIVPPALMDSNVIKKIPDAAITFCSGWMQVRGSRRWRSADAGFAVSDHADWHQLLEAVKNTGAEKVHVTHGFEHTFAKYLNEIGISADVVSANYSGNEDDTESPAEEMRKNFETFEDD